MSVIHFSITAMTMICQHSSLRLIVPIMLQYTSLHLIMVNCYRNTLGGGTEKHPQRYTDMLKVFHSIMLSAVFTVFNLL